MVVGLGRTGFTFAGAHGFHVTFGNGWTVSVQWGDMNYCRAYPKNTTSPTNVVSPALGGPKHSPNAEVAVFDPTHSMLGDPIGWVSSDALVGVFDVVSRADRELDTEASKRAVAYVMELVKGSSPRG